MLVSRPNPVFDRPPRPLQRTRRRLLGHRYSRAVAINRQAIVLSFAGGTPYSPRAQRARMVATALEELLACPVERVPPAGRPYAVDDGSRPAPTVFRKARTKLVKDFVFDECEPLARRTLRDWQPSGLGAVIVGWPYSPLYYGAQRLVATGVPYVVDIGDPWALTATKATADWKRVPARARDAERFIWEHAAGGVVTTATQEDALQRLFPRLALLCRPNGYFEVTATDSPAPASGRPAGELRLVQYGSVYPVRVPIGGWLARLREAGGFDRISFVNYGSVGVPELLESDDPGVVVEVRAPIEWDDAWRAAHEFDAAVVVGNKDPAQLPSKAIQYLTLPIPRLALTGGGPGDELAAFAAEEPAFLAVDVNDAEGPSRAIAHVRRQWTAAELAPPPEHSWPAVARRVARFASDRWQEAGGDRAEAAPAVGGRGSEGTDVG